MSILLHPFRGEREYRELVASLKEQRSSRIPRPARMIGLCEGARHALFGALLEDVCEKRSGPALLLVPDEKEAVRCATALAALGHTPLVYNYRDFVFYNITASHEYEHERLGVLTAILENACDVVIATPDAALQYTIPKERLAAATRTLSSSDTVELEEIRAFLTESGYQSVEMVDGVGQFSVR
ncbi:MAG: hypothetical protein IJD10_00005, partial [Clostridia bacterium]|nr:hypothetical protein [Clostridia bacterium]